MRMMFISLLLLLAIGQGQSKISESDSARCPENFVLFEHANHDACLHVSSKLLTMAGSQQYCHELGGVLVAIDTEIQNDQVSSAIASPAVVWIQKNTLVPEGHLGFSLVNQTLAIEEAAAKFGEEDDKSSLLPSTLCSAFESRAWRSKPCANLYPAVCSAEPAALAQGALAHAVLLLCTLLLMCVHLLNTCRVDGTAWRPLGCGVRDHLPR
jgi:hypothetical protein